MRTVGVEWQQVSGWHWCADWSEALRIAVQRAHETGFRYRVRRSHAEPRRWLVMRELPLREVAR
jgi:hypothetical protein